MFLTTVMRLFCYKISFSQNMILKYVPNINQTVYEHKCMPTELTNELMTYVRDGEERRTARSL